MASNHIEMQLSAGQLADLFGVTGRRIAQMAAEGMPRIDRGKYDLKSCVQWYLRKRADGTGKRAELADARNSLYVSQKEKTDLEVAKLKRSVIDAGEVERVVLELAAIFSSQLEAVGGRLANELAALHDPNTVLQRLTEETRQIRRNTADLVQTFADSLDSRNDTASAA